MLPIGAHFIIVSGPPGSGKSTLASVLMARLSLPLISKDVIKEALMSTLHNEVVKDSNDLGAASMKVMYAMAGACPSGAILEANFYRSFALDEINALPGPKIEVFCRCTKEVALARYRERAGARDSGHFDNERSNEQLWNPETNEPISGEWPLIQVDTTHQVDIEEVVRSIHNNLQSS